MLSGRITRSQTQRLETSKAHVGTLKRVLEGFSPQANLNRGYAIVRKVDTVVRSTAQASKGDKLVIQLSDGYIRSEVVQTKE